MKNALISVIIPVYNVSEYIKRAVSSLLSQTYQNIEIILINDGSTDNSGEVCRQLKDKHANKIVYIEQENQGVSAARNAGLNVARGEYIMFVDADDWVLEEYVEKLYLAIISNNADLASCGFVEWYDERRKKHYIRPNPAVYDKSSYYKTMLLQQVPLWTTIYKTSIIREKGIKFDTLLRRMEDGCFVADYSSYCDRFVIIPEYLYFYYQRENSVMHTNHRTTLLGVERSAYIIDKLEKAYIRSDVELELCAHQFTSKWIGFIPGVAIGLSHIGNELKRKEKKEFLKKSIEISLIKERLNSRNLSKCTFCEKILVRWIAKNRVGFLLFYGKIFNLLRKIKHRLKGRK